MLVVNGMKNSKRGSRETSWQTPIGIQVCDNGSLNKMVVVKVVRSGEKWSGSRSILNM